MEGIRRHLNALFKYFRIGILTCFRDKLIVLSAIPENPLNENLECEPGPNWERFGFIVDMDHANMIFNRHRYMEHIQFYFSWQQAAIFYQ